MCFICIYLHAFIHFSTSFSLEFHIRFFYGDEFYAISAPFYIKNLEFISHGIVSNSKKGNFDWRMCMEFISCEGLNILEGFMASILNLIYCSCVIKWRIQSFCNDRYILSILECLQSLQKIKKVEITSHLWRTVTKLATIQIFHWYYIAVDIQNILVHRKNVTLAFWGFTKQMKLFVKWNNLFHKRFQKAVNFRTKMNNFTSFHPFYCKYRII